MIFDILLHWLVYYLWPRLPFTFVLNWFYKLDKLRSDGCDKTVCNIDSDYTVLRAL